MKKITLITANPRKAEQLQKHISCPVSHQALDLSKIQSLDVIAVAKDKAQRAFTLLNGPVIVEDTALIFKALGGLPGPLIKWFLEAVGSQGLCALLSTHPDRTATAVTCIAYQDKHGQHVFTGETTGKIADAPHHHTDFGWNNIFIPDGSQITWAEMSVVNMEKDSMRLQAVRKLNEYLKLRDE